MLKKFSLKNFEEIGMPKLNSVLSIKLLDKRQKIAGIILNEDVKDKIFENSQGIPQMIIYNASTLIEINKDLKEFTIETWKTNEEMVKDGFGRELIDLPDDERKILHAFAMEPANFSDIGMLMRSTQIEQEVLSVLLC